VMETTDTMQNGQNLRLVMLSGDWIPLSVPGFLKKKFASVEVAALGGATEAAIWSNYYIVEAQDDDWRSIPYGKPIQNARYYVLGDSLEIKPIGAIGDLYIGGECLAEGYFNDTTLSHAKFIPNPYVENERIYKTGDLARWMPKDEVFGVEGNLEFLGRTDSQVKIRGYRVELGEIENRLMKHPLISSAIVSAHQGKSKEKYLCGYYVSDVNINKEELIDFLRNDLPDYMVPVFFIQIADIPLTANGKLNRAILPLPELNDAQVYVAPSGEYEERLVEILAEILKLDKQSISIGSNFFELGGHSLNAAILQTRIKDQFKVRIQLVDLFKASTIQAIGELIESQLWAKGEIKSNTVERDQILI
jgi:surfactin family lipopeptide synthetase A